LKKILLILAGVAMASLSLAQLSKYKDWAKSPEAYFLTPSEREAWSAVKSDDEAEKFIATYWAKRDPTPATTQNEFKDGVMRRIAAADEQFKARRYAKGSESARGHVFIVLGAPNRATQTALGPTDGGATPDTGLGAPGTAAGGARSDLSGGSPATVNWTYNKDHFTADWGIPEMRVRFSVDPMRGSDDMAKDPIVDRAMAVIAEKTIVNPGAVAGGAAAPAAPASTGVTVSKPTVPTVGAAGAAAAAPPPPAPATATLPAATRASLDALVKEKKDEPNQAYWGGPFHSIPGDGFYAFQLYITADKAPTGPARFGGIVTTASGQEAASYWEEVTLSEMKTGSRADKVYERSIVLPAGNYRGAFGLFTPDGATALASASATFRIDPKPADFNVSPLILTNTLTPLTKRPSPTDPFVFGMDKPIRVEPKADRRFTKQDSLWYFYTVWNPKLPEAAAAAPAPAAPAPAAPAGTPPAAAAAPEVKPRIQARIGVLKDGQPAFAPLTGPAEMQMLSPTYYATGSEIPLASFEPGFYTFTLTVRDLGAARDSAAFKGIDRKEDFIVLKADGSMPDKAAPVKPAPKPKPPAKKG
jgi:GWxTD domain-containing protein